MNIILRLILFSMDKPMYKVIFKPMFYILSSHKENKDIPES
jgi:hypothetical protein